MPKLSHRQKENFQKIDSNFHYNLEDSIKLLKKTATAKFIESVELHANLNINPKYADQQLRATVTLPNGIGKKIRIAVLVSESRINEIKTINNADIIGDEDLIKEITAGNINFDLLITTPDMMPKLAKLGRILGPKGLMPSPKSGTVTTSIESTLNEFKKGKFEYKADKTGIVHVNFGKSDFSEDQLTENLQALYKSIEQNRPTGVKGKFFKSLYVSTTMGPSIKVNLESFL